MLVYVVYKVWDNKKLNKPKTKELVGFCKENLFGTYRKKWDCSEVLEVFRAETHKDAELHFNNTYSNLHGM